MPPMDLSVFNSAEAQNGKVQDQMHRFAQQLKTEHEDHEGKHHLKGVYLFIYYFFKIGTYLVRLSSTYYLVV